MLRWALRFDGPFELAVELAHAIPLAPPERMIVHELKNLDLPDRYPQASIDFLAHALRGQSRDNFWECPDAQEIARRAIATGLVSEPARTALVEELLRLGCAVEGLT